MSEKKLLTETTGAFDSVRTQDWQHPAITKHTLIMLSCY